MRRHLAELHAKQISDLLKFHRDDKERWDAERAGLLEAQAEERLRWERERQILLNRIDPKTSQWVDPELPASPAMIGPVEWDDDEAEMAERESREQMADRAWQEELAERNGG